MKHKRFVTKIMVLMLGAGGTFSPGSVLAQAYGQASYSTVEYSSGAISVGPITLPNTGTTWAGLGALALAALITGVLAYRRARHNH